MVKYYFPKKNYKIFFPFIIQIYDNKKMYAFSLFKLKNWSSTFINESSTSKVSSIINVYVFAKCSSLSQVISENNSSLKSIWISDFSYCISLEPITIPSSVADTNENVFDHCSSL